MMCDLIDTMKCQIVLNMNTDGDDDDNDNDDKDDKDDDDNDHHHHCGDEIVVVTFAGCSLMHRCVMCDV